MCVVWLYGSVVCVEDGVDSDLDLVFLVLFLRVVD